jgi:hypothetical protein
MTTPPAGAPLRLVIWYTVTENEGQEIISVQHVSLDTSHPSGRNLNSGAGDCHVAVMDTAGGWPMPRRS